MSTAAQPRTLDAAPPSAGYHHHAKREPVDIAHLKRVVSLAMVLSRYGVLADFKRAGAQLTGVCPIHQGSNPSQFVVHLASNNWFCFSPECNRGGSMLDFVALKEGVSIAGAARLVADWFAVVSPTSHRQQYRPQRRKRMSTMKPSHKVFVVQDAAEGREPGDEQSGFWCRIGSAWPHKDGRGLSIVLNALPVGNRMVLREYTEEDEARESKPVKRK
jgi:hypothetical protein